MAKKLDLPFHLLSDPRGDLIKHYGLWNENKGVSEPAIVALDGSGTVRSLYSGGTDFADRPQEESLLYILDRVGGDGEYEGSEPEIRISAEVAENETVRPDKPAMTLEQLRPYYQGVYFAAVSMKKKARTKASREGTWRRSSTATRSWSPSTTGRSKRPSR
jgi:hypothetical protein